MNIFNKLSTYNINDMSIHYWIDEDQIVGMTITPYNFEFPFAERRTNINCEPTIRSLYKVFNKDFPAYHQENLVQLKVIGDIQPSPFAGGTSSRNSEATQKLKFVEQNIVDGGIKNTIITKLADDRGLIANHYVICWSDQPFIETYTEIKNNGATAIKLEMLSSFSLGGLSPYQSADGVGCYNVHRFLSTWSAEGRHECQPIEKLNLEKSWASFGVRSLKFGQVGSMPVKGYFPFVALEDNTVGVIWGAQLAIPGSWQLEVSRISDLVNISGGLADREFGHWVKTLDIGSSFETPKAILSCCKGDIQDLTNRMVQYQNLANEKLPKTEADLPIIFNDWCTTWGNPSEENIIKIADSLKNSQVKYLVMDDGWFNDKPGIQQSIGDWNISKTIYPRGFKILCQELVKKGFIPGIWFELESCTRDSSIFEMKEHLLHKDGHILQVGNRRFLDFRDPWVHEYLYEKVIKMLKENGITYIKTDYNDTIGIGCDGSDSLGEGLREHLVGVQKFYKRMRNEIPNLVIEICSSGGHRLEPSWLSLGSMGGFSDSHEGLDIPIIAANTQMMVTARKNLIWAVLRKDDSISRIYYSMSATFLGRMCISGDIFDLTDEQMRCVNAAQRFYNKVKKTISDGFSRRFGTEQLSYTVPKGYQAHIRTNSNGNEAFVTIHTFQNAPKEISVQLDGVWTIYDAYKQEHLNININGEKLVVSGLKDFNGLVIALKR